MLREITGVLRRARDAWLYAGIVNAEPMHAPKAEATFQQHAEDARRRFREALIRNAGATGTVEAHAQGGEGLAVITLIVAARGHLLDFHDMADIEQVRRCLESLAGLTSTALTAVEIVWAPVAENERLSAVRAGSLVSGTRCASCDGPLLADLASCPHCGARVSEQAAS